MPRLKIRFWRRQSFLNGSKAWKKLPVSQGRASGNAKSKRSTKMEASMRKPVPTLLNIALGFHCQSGANGIKPVEHHQIITRECAEIDGEGRH